MNSNRFYLLYFSFIILILACSVFGNPVKTNVPNQNLATVTDKPESLVEPTAPQKAVSTSTGGENTDQQQVKPGEIRQWAISARASSEYSNPNWAAIQAVGEPNVNECGDNNDAWASKNDNTVEWIELSYKTPVIPTVINIFQSYNPSQVVEVKLISPNGEKYIAWEGYPESVKNCPDLMEITVDKKITVNKIQITVDQRVNGWGWNEIDAVELVGRLP